MSAQRIHHGLVAERQFGGSYDSVKRFVRQLAEASPLLSAARKGADYSLSGHNNASWAQRKPVSAGDR